MGPVFAHNLGVCNFVAAVDRDIFVLDDPESVSSLDTLFFWGLYIPYLCLGTGIPVRLNTTGSTFSCIWGGVVVGDVPGFCL